LLAGCASKEGKANGHPAKKKHRKKSLSTILYFSE